MYVGLFVTVLWYVVCIGSIHGVAACRVVFHAVATHVAVSMYICFCKQTLAIIPLHAWKL